MIIIVVGYVFVCVGIVVIVVGGVSGLITHLGACNVQNFQY